MKGKETSKEKEWKEKPNLRSAPGLAQNKTGQDSAVEKVRRKKRQVECEGKEMGLKELNEGETGPKIFTGFGTRYTKLEQK